MVVMMDVVAGGWKELRTCSARWLRHWECWRINALLWSSQEEVEQVRGRDGDKDDDYVQRIWMVQEGGGEGGDSRGSSQSTQGQRERDDGDTR